MTSAGTGATADADTPTCAAASVTAQSRATTPGLDWAENLTFDPHGDLWVSRLLRNEVERYDAAGRVTGVVPVRSPGAIRVGPDGLMYVVSGDSPLALPPGSGTVVRFDPASPSPRVFATGFVMPNGLAFDGHGRVYVADSGFGLIRLRRDGSVDQEWTSRAPKNFDAAAHVDGTSIDGIAVDRNAVYVTVLASSTGRVLRVPLDDPSNSTVAAQLTLGPLPAGPDDLAVSPDGALYVATATGRLVRVDPRTRVTCAVAWGEPMTSVALSPAPGHPLVVGTESGDLLVIRER
jgi:sugar lactone lactonase YvrE